MGALHDTADDSVKYYDLEALPPTLSVRFEEAYAPRSNWRGAKMPVNAAVDSTTRHSLSSARCAAACRGSFRALAQPRPEYGHCTNSICIVGRRAWSRGLHLDRRAFLVSYDPGVDDNHKVLERILAAVGPVGAGISLEYYFVRRQRNVRLRHQTAAQCHRSAGCDERASERSHGLPLQMVEIH